MRKLTVGCDPELFLRDNNTSGIIPACGLVGGTKKEPLEIAPGVWVQEDNVTVEFNIDPVEHKYGQDVLYDHTRNGFNEVTRFVRNKVGHVSLWYASHVEFQTEQLQSEQARMFGCDPDLNAYRNGLQNPLIEVAEVGNKRFAGGHMHFGYPKNEVPVPEYAFVQMLEALVLTHYVNLSPGFIGNERVKFYGKPGAFRKKPYGFEWRTPSNSWLQHRGMAQRACDFMLWAINNQQECRALYDRIDFAEVERQLSEAHPSDQLTQYLDDLYFRYVNIPAVADENRAPRRHIENEPIEDLPPPLRATPAQAAAMVRLGIRVQGQR